MDWSEKFAAADALVDEELGDEIEFASDGVTFEALKCFVYPEGAEADISYSPIDPVSGKPRLKIAVAKLAQPTKNPHRFKVPQLAPGAVIHWRAENWTKIDSGRYWLIDIQKAVT